ncbi:MAG TPA: hypothetical protein VGW98_10125 [Solirubrobacteraceae bacterium]|nr:hypothetical protein [Solirubrobacteraceae bacterium]
MTSSRHSRRSLPSPASILAGALVLMAFGTAPAFAAAGGATGNPSTNGSPAASQTGTTAPTVRSSTRTFSVRINPAPRRASSSTSTAAIALAALAALVALSAAVWGFARRRALEPRWSASMRHTMAEAGFRASATWAEFTDWVRLGR